MPLILAIEPDKRQGARIAALARERLNVELVVMESVERAIKTIDERVPDLILTPLMLSGKDEAALDERLRRLDAAGSHVQTLMIPVLASSTRRSTKAGKGLLTRLRKKGPAADQLHDGCDPEIFASQIAEYLDRHAREIETRAQEMETRAEDERARRVDEPAANLRADAVEAALELDHAVPETDQFVELPREDELGAVEPGVRDVAHDRRETPLLSTEDLEAVAAPFLAHNQSQDSETLEPERTILDVRSVETDEALAAELVSVPDDLFEQHAVAPEEPAPVDPAPVEHAQLEAPAALEARDAEPALEAVTDVITFESLQVLKAPDRSAENVETVSCDEFVSFDDLDIVDAPSVSFGDLAGIMDVPSDLFDDGVRVSAAAEIDKGEGLDLTNLWQDVRRALEPEPAQVVRKAERSPAIENLDLSEAPGLGGGDVAIETELWASLPAAPPPIAHAETEPAALSPKKKAGKAHPDARQAAASTDDLSLPTAEELALPPAADPALDFPVPVPAVAAKAANKKATKAKPFQDEWGFFDPVQCGFTALLAKLDEVTDKDDTPSGTTR